MNGDNLRDGIFALHTRRFGSVAEVLIERLCQLGKARNQFHDLYDDVARHKVEVKFSRVQRASETKITKETVLQCVEEATTEQRTVRYADWKRYRFDCNIQQIKRAEFDILYYGLFFYDRILIFSIESGQIGSQIYYSDKQHKGNVGEGQFHIHQDSLQIHLDNYLYKELTYDELLELLSE
jgi:hypothetical protein